MKAIFWMGVGAAAMYLLDPREGRNRRAQLQHTLSHYRRMVQARAGQAAPPVELEAQTPSETPPGAYHLGR